MKFSMSIINNKIDVNLSDDLLASSLPARPGLYRSLSAKRSRDPSHRKSVSFNDVPIVHEVPLYDSVRNSNFDTYRSWAYIEPTPAISIISPFSSSPLYTSNTTNHKVNTMTRSNSTLSSSTNRSNDGSTRNKTLKIIEDTLDHNSSCNPPLIIVHKPEERSNINTNLTQSLISEISEERKHSYRPATPHHSYHHNHYSEHARSLPFTYVPLSESSIIYTSLLSSHQSSNEQNHVGNTRTTRIRSATIPISSVHSSTRHNENNSMTTTRPTTASTRIVLKPATIAFQCSQQPAVNFPATKPPTVSTRSTSTSAHARLLSSLNRPLSSSFRYNFAHPSPDSIIKSSHTTSLARSRSANILNTRRHATSPVSVLDGQSEGTNIYLSTKRTPNMRNLVVLITLIEFSCQRILTEKINSICFFLYL
ncbi:hypothetical protein I4U23_012776 [Adineta vaga]|nr:hypothetical protein I4U23_012776 [Adineta vaga]